MEINQLEKIIASANGAIAERRRLAEIKECNGSATKIGSAKNSQSLAEAHESDLLQLIHGSRTVVDSAQLKRLLRDVERLNFWQTHDWYAGERTLEGEWRFFDADGNSCKGASLREALDQLKVLQPDLRGQISDDDAWEG
ncbi:hypothetical protein [Pseudomonas mandelii]|jgi:hypothetical protein|uniref:Uncharacterized protein n=1 Tax=Pseudomonas mandelii TaxID=75612 RepID=A0A502IED8_9PSED|nr:hypothetical protein [Pseudomonas mandelii]TPG84755.1 hypothetical protein EAH74_12065 [Pseudomonas mandelii]